MGLEEIVNKYNGCKGVISRDIPAIFYLEKVGDSIATWAFTNNDSRDGAKPSNFASISKKYNCKYSWSCFKYYSFQKESYQSFMKDTLYIEFYINKKYNKRMIKVEI